MSGEIEFTRWMEASGRLSNLNVGNWYDTADQYLTASRFAGERLAAYLRSGSHCADSALGQLEPGVAEWALFVLVADDAQADTALAEALLPDPLSFGVGLEQSGMMQMAFWYAHNAALRHGVWLADQRDLRNPAREPQEERDMMNIVLYTVLEPGDQCARGSFAFCLMTFTVFEQVGLGWYPPHYPGSRADLDRLLSNYWIFFDGEFRSAGLSVVYATMAALGARMPSDEHHCLNPVVNAGSPCHR